MRSSHVAGAGFLVIAASFIAPWEGLWTTAQIDTIGTGEPVTVCYGATKAEIPDLKVGQKFTRQECTHLLIKSLPRYWNSVANCIHSADAIDLPDSAKAALTSASYNAGSSAICHSPMIAKINAGDVRGGCEAFAGWYVRAQGRVVKGLVNRRISEKNLCLSGLNSKPKPPPETFWTKLLNFIKGLFNGHR